MSEEIQDEEIQDAVVTICKFLYLVPVPVPVSGLYAPVSRLSPAGINYVF